MPKNRKNSLKVIDNLAEITSHSNRNVIEKSLIKSLHEINPKASLRLFSVRNENDTLVINLLARNVQEDSTEIHGHSDTHKVNVKQLNMMFEQVVESEAIETFPCESTTDWHTVYPAFDGKGHIFSVLLFTFDKPDFITQQIINSVLKVYANYVNILDKSERDKLTGLYNRETLDEKITSALVNKPGYFQPNIENDKRKNTGLIRTFLGLIDIDHFKSINDKYGHVFGDDILILIAQEISSHCIRDTDLVFRYGGEEFVVLIEAPDSKSAHNMLNRLCSNIRKRNFAQIEQVTVSIGFEEITTQSSPHAILRSADKALYYAKNSGRDRVECYQDLLDEKKIEPDEFETGEVVYF